MAESIKSALHDATPSWNGYNYQGKVGLYVCLKLIKDNLEANNTDSPVFLDFIDEHAIEYEWIEDFGIKRNGHYISLHQVKHKAGTAFSEHVSAMVTILNRKLGRLSETDFIKYYNPVLNYDDCNTNEEKHEKAFIDVQAKMKSLRVAGYLDDENKLQPNWRSVQQGVDGLDAKIIEALCDEFEQFTANSFESSNVYFHTAENVAIPIKDINQYAGIPDNLRESVNGLRSLSGLDIFLGFDEPCEYALCLSDADLFSRIGELVEQILRITMPDETFCADDLLIYQAALCQAIDRHIAARHSDIRNKKNNGTGFGEQRASLPFRELFNLLQSLIQYQGDEYWARFCTYSFEDAFSHELKRLENMIEQGHDAEINKKRIENLDRRREILIANYSYTDLLKMLSPHLIQKPDVSIQNFFDSLSNKNAIVNVFLKFMRELASENKGFIVQTGDALAYYPTAINVGGSDEHERNFELGLLRHGIKKNKHLFQLADASHLVINIDSNHDLANERVEILSVVERIDSEKDVKNKHSINDVSSILFESVEAAIRNL